MSAHKTCILTPAASRTRISDSSSALQRLPSPDDEIPCVTRCCWVFERPTLRRMYARYARRSRRDAPAVVVLVALLFSVQSVLVSSLAYSAVRLPHVAVSGVLVLLHVVALLLHRKLRTLDLGVPAVAYYGWAALGVQMGVNIGLGEGAVALSDGLEWTLVYVYVTVVVLPFRLGHCVAMSLLSLAVQLVPVLTLSLTRGPATERHFSATMLAGQVLLYVAVYALATVTHIVREERLRLAFQHSRTALSASMEIQETAKEQESLLLSVLPKHVAEEMVQDIDATGATGQFRKIYMNRHENVSILFADIVGFTAMSSMVTASELVRILNDLFANFDILGEKYHQLRIKILGDCYYCICGCPTQRSDHAVLAVHMGLSMVEAIRQVRERTQSGVNMRVGVHSGAVLGGVLGQVRWQYDVFGKEVTLANKMESGGIPGRVHISDATARWLSGEFELEAGEGETREDAIKQAGMKTFLIKTVVKPYPQGTLDESTTTDQAQNGTSVKGHSHQEAESQGPSGRQTSERHSTQSDAEEGTSDFFAALMEREDKTLIRKELHAISLTFKDRNLESTYYKAPQRGQHWCLVAAGAAVTWCQLVALAVVNEGSLWVVISLVSASLALTAMAIITYLASIRMAGGGATCWRRLSHWLLLSRQGMLLWANLAVVILVTTTLLSALGCGAAETFPSSFAAANASFLSSSLEGISCPSPQYFNTSGLLVLLVVTSLLDVEYLFKVTLIAVTATCYSLLPMVVMPTALDLHDVIMASAQIFPDPAYRIYSLTTVIFAALGCTFICRHSELLFRKLHLFTHDAGQVSTKIEAMRSKNEALVYNILPAHVARDFIGKAKDDDELYSQAYEEVGVMFAACPNFNDFYTEDAVNNNGLECIRVMNEILSDYDDLLEEPRFRAITKIKTIGPTYMAASGIDQGNAPAQDAGPLVRWQHLADLIEFAFALKDSLNKINAQSFNNFMLRIGINHGSILAGVIGARKPHYDIWGNTVNVSSRMESTGQLGKIQVVESTMEVLRQFGYTFQQRGLIRVKGKGDLMTYFLTGRETVVPGREVDSLPNQVTQL